jgi:hypothetical protein
VDIEIGGGIVGYRSLQIPTTKENNNEFKINTFLQQQRRWWRRRVPTMEAVVHDQLG